MRIIVILLGTALVTFSLALRAEWQWSGADAEGYEEEDQASEAIWSDEDCEAISEAAGFTYTSRVTSSSDLTRPASRRKKRPYSKPGLH